MRSKKTNAYAFISALLLAQTIPFAPARADEVTPVVPQVPNTTSTTAELGLSIAAGATHVLDVSANPVIDFGTGNLNNLGTLYIISTNPQVTSGTINAQNIFNGAGGLITTILPTGGLPNYTNAISNLSLTLNAINNIINNGTINSANNLTVMAGGTIVNASAATSSVQAVMQATNNLNIVASTLANSGVLASINSNVNIANATALASVQQMMSANLVTSLTEHVTVNNTAGIIQALNGEINIGGGLTNKSSILNVIGGTLDSPITNLDGGAGAVEASLDNVLGALNVSACAAHISADSGLLTLGNINIAGDPTFFNYGDILINNNISVGEALSIVATGNITANGAYLIRTNTANIGYDVTMIAGAAITPAGATTAAGTLPSINQLGALQTLQVSGGSAGGGFIDLANSTISAQSTTGDNKGGKVTLVAFSGTNLGSGSISNANIITGGNGTGANSPVKLIAGATLGTAITGVAVSILGGSKFQPADISLFAARPGGGMTFLSNGTALGDFNPVFFNNADINLTKALINDSGNVNIKTGANFSSTIAGTISTSGIEPGRKAGDINIEAKSITISGALSAIGQNGAAGTVGLPGFMGGAGGDGGDGGAITLKSIDAITINADITSRGGNGGVGGAGGAGAVGQAGGMGGAGGSGGLAKLLSFSTSNAPIVQTAGTISTVGGSGGAGGMGGIGGAPGVFLAGAGGSGGLGGGSASGGNILVRPNAGNVFFDGTIDIHGGDGGAGGAGANGGSDPTKAKVGGAGGNSGVSRAGSGGGILNILNTTGNIRVNNVNGVGGVGGVTGASGIGGDGLFGGAGGMVFGGGGGGGGGTVLLNSTSGTIGITGTVNLLGGNGAAQTNNAGKGGEGGIAGGAGGAINGAGDAGMGGMLSAVTDGNVSVTGNIDVSGGMGGEITSTAGAGGGATVFGGFGGAIFTSGDGGGSGSVSLTSFKGTVNATQTIKADGGAAGNMAGTAGAGGSTTALLSQAGFGGAAGGGGLGGGGGGITLTAKTGIDATGTTLLARGGHGGNVSGIAGAGGNSGALGTAGMGGALFSGGFGGGGGMIRLSTETGNIPVREVDASGGNGGGVTGLAGKGGDGAFGAMGGAAFDSGFGGGGGMITLKTTQMATTPLTGLITVDGGQVKANGGVSGSYTAIAGNGGTGLSFNGGAGGSTGNQGFGGGGGNVGITATNVTVTATGRVSANGGSTSIDILNLFLPGYQGISGDGGNGGGVSGGGNGGRVGNAGNAGGGGFVSINAPGAISLTSDINGSDAVAARGGTVADFRASSGKGGNGGTGIPTPGIFALSANGGNGGDIGNNGNAGAGGNIQITGGSGAILGLGVVSAAGGQVGTLLSVGHTGRSGAGGDGGVNGNGGRSGQIGSNGDGGRGGNISVTTTTGAINVAPLIAAGGDVNASFNARTGNGGKGGTSFGNGGTSGGIGNNGSGGGGGFIFVSSFSGNIAPIDSDPDPKKAAAYIVPGGPVRGSNSITGNGGSATIGNGGNTGDIGNNGKAGGGGIVIILNALGNIVTTKGSIVATGGDGGFANGRTGDGGISMLGNGGNTGSIGKNSDGANGGFVSIAAALGSITTGGAIILRGGVGNGNTNRTGDGGNGTSRGGNSGSILNGGNGGKGGTIFMYSTGAMTTSENIVADGGNAAAQNYSPRTGKGGDALPGGGFGGSAGSIGDAGTGGEGGQIFATTLLGALRPDHMFVDGGTAGSLPVPGVSPGYDGAMRAQTGNGGHGGQQGGDVGTIGKSVVGGKAGTIYVSSGAALTDSVEFKADGGAGGAQRSIGGAGGKGDSGSGGSGGDVLNAGAGGDGGTITLLAKHGPSKIKEVEMFGGAGGGQFGVGGAGGDGGAGTQSLGRAGGAGGDVGDSGDGGTGGSLTVTLSRALFLNSDLAVIGNAGMLAYGGEGGIQNGVAGAGGNGLGLLLTGGGGGGGGQIGVTGGGGKGGTIKLTVPGVLDMGMGTNTNGGASGLGNGVGGAGGFGTFGLGPGTSMMGGAGGQVLGQRGAGNAGVQIIQVDSLNLPGGLRIAANGGDAQAFAPTGGNGGAGGGAGGAGGQIGGAGAAGDGAYIQVQASGNLNIDGGVTSNGGNRLAVIARGGDGGNAGVGGGNGGDGGDIITGGKAGGGGRIELSSIFGGVTGIPPLPMQLPANSGFTQADGGNVVMPAIPSPSRGGNGGNGMNSGSGGAGGDVGKQGDAGGSGSISITAFGVIDMPNHSAKGGSIIGDYDAIGGNGGNGGNARVGEGKGGGKGGIVAGAGTAGSSNLLSAIEIRSLTGNITLNQVTASGGSVDSFTGRGGQGGSQLNLLASGDGGVGGMAGDNGSGGNGGKVTVSTFGAVTATGDWNVNGGSVGSYSGIGGNGGATIGTEGDGGIGGGAGDNGAAGKGGGITVTTLNGNQLFKGQISGKGGSVGAYSGVGGDGGAGKNIGGNGGSAGAGGVVGPGGDIRLVAFGGGNITVEAGKDIDVRAGASNIYQGRGGLGATGGSGVDGDVSGSGGSVGPGIDAVPMNGVSSGGTVSLYTTFGNISLGGAVFADGGQGGTSTGFAQDGQPGNPKGGDGGAAIRAGHGGKGGTVKLQSVFGTITVAGAVSATGGNGGVQFNRAGNGGNGTIKGGNGGFLGGGGDGGGGGSIQFQAGGGLPTFSGGLNVQFGIGGAQQGIPGLKGTPGGLDGLVDPAGKNGTPGSILPFIVGDAEQGELGAKKFKQRIASKRISPIESGSLTAHRRTAGSEQLASNMERSSLTEFNYADFVEAPETSNNPYRSLEAVNQTESMNPVSLVQMVPAAPKMTASTLAKLGINPAVALVVEAAHNPQLASRVGLVGAKLAPGEGTTFTHKEGELFFAPTKSITVAIPEGTLSIAAGAKVLVEVNDTGTMVRNLNDQSRGDVQYISGKFVQPVHVGNELFVSSTHVKPHQSLKDQVATRNTVAKTLPSGVNLVTSEFSILSAIANNPILKSLYGSSSKSDKKHMEPIYKNAVILTMLTAARGAFKQ